MIGVLSAVIGGLALGMFLQRRRERQPRRQALRAAAEPGGGPLAMAAAPREELRHALEAVRSTLGARRAVVWDLIAEDGLAAPVLAAGGERGPRRTLAGDPMQWAWREGTPLRLDSAPAWALAEAGAAAIVPLERGGSAYALLTLDYGAAGEIPSLETLEMWARYVRAFTRAELRDREADAGRLRAREILQVLRRLPRDIDLDAFAKELAESARTLAGATGAAVATWSDGRGAILAVAGEDGGPKARLAFGPQDSEMGISAHQAAVIQRERRRSESRRLPIATPGERWAVEPRAAAAVPLVEAGRGVIGVVAVWTTEGHRLDPEALGAIEAVAPYAALQLRHAQDYCAAQENALRDPLTGLHNRRAFEERLTHEGSRVARYERPLALIMADIDHFKRVNDTHGHEAGDAVLRALAGVLSASLRETDLAARFGGEEFVVLLPETGAAAAAELAERLRARVERLEVEWEGGRIPVRASFGVSACPECVPGPQELVQSADAMLYQSKRSGRNGVSVASPGGG